MNYYLIRLAIILTVLVIMAACVEVCHLIKWAFGKCSHRRELKRL